MPTRIQTVRKWLRSDMRVMRWVLLGLYVALIAGLSAPLLMTGDDEAFTFCFILLGIIFASQALFIFGAGTINLCHPIRKARLWMPVLAATAMAFILFGGFTLAMTELFFEDNLGDGPGEFILGCLIYGNWIIWAPLFWAYTRRKRRHDALTRLAAWLLVGSLAELLACVPAHVVSSRRSYCLAGVMTMIGICAGLVVMVFSFGPALALLFLRPRHRRERLEGDPLCAGCGYNLRGTIDAGRDTCPECGAAAANLAR